MPPPMSGLVESADTVEIVTSLLLDDGGIVDLGLDAILARHDLAARALRATTDGLGEMFIGLQLSFLPRQDSCTSSTCSGAELASWKLDDEPAAPRVETWARGMVKVRSKRQARPSTRASTAGTRGSVTGTRRRRKQMRERAAAAEAAAKGIIKVSSMGESTATIIESKASGSGAAGTALKPLAPVKSKELEELEALQQQEFARVEALQNGLLEEQKKLAETQERLKGKTFTYNGDGSVLMIEKMPPERLMNPVHVGLALADGQGRLEGDIRSQRGRESPTSSRGGSRSPKARGKKKRKRKKRPSGLKDGDSTFVPDKNVQPPLLNTIDLAPGVKLTEGSGTKQAPRLASDPMRMTRAAFAAHMADLERGEGVGGPAVDDPLSDFATTLGDYGMTDAKPVVMPTKKMVMPGTPDTVGSRPGSRPYSSGPVRDIDPLGDARARSDAGPDQEVYDENAILLSAPDWGMNSSSPKAFEPAHLPGKKHPGQLELAETFGQKFVKKTRQGSMLLKPRDRPFVHHDKLTHRAPPMFPAVTVADANRIKLDPLSKSTSSLPDPTRRGAARRASMKQPKPMGKMLKTQLSKRYLDL